MLHLSALALGPLLARAAPKLSSGNVGSARTISLWLSERLADPVGKFAKVLTRTSDRAWRSVEIALAGEELHRFAIVSGADRALVEQIRQFVSVASSATASPDFRRQIQVDLQKARRAEIIPGPLPSANALAAMIVRYLVGESEETLEAEANHLAKLGPELRTAGLNSLAEFIESRPENQPHLLINAARYFLSREIADDLGLLRDLRYSRVELLPEYLRAGFDRIADALDRFSSVLIDMLAQLIGPIDKPEPAPPEATPPEPPPTPAQESPKVEEPGFAIVGADLVAPVRTGEDGARFAPCPVCRSHIALNRRAAAWVSLSCKTCGTEFQATDGSKPPPTPPPTIKTDADGEHKPRVPGLKRNLQLWIDSGGPKRWIEHHKGMWNNAEFGKLADILRVSHFWPLDLGEVRKVLTEMTAQYRIRGTGWAEPLLRTKPERGSSGGLVRTSDVYRTIDGNCWVPCPLCRSFNVEIPPRSTGEITVTCSGCWRSFLVDLRKRRPSVLPPVPPPPPPPSLWGKIRKLFGG